MHWNAGKGRSQRFMVESLTMSGVQVLEIGEALLLSCFTGILKANSVQGQGQEMEWKMARYMCCEDEPLPAKTCCS